ncbi:MAG: hypothetical protein PHU70_06495 [Dehalococcoidia bacterium]|nr:hypothetical protein [Dehalococcoidia bacterium]
MKKKAIIAVMSLVLLMTMLSAGCISTGISSEQYMALQGQVNSLNNSLNSTQQQLSSTQQQLNTTQQSLAEAQSKLQQQNTYVTSAQPAYQPTVIYYRTYSYGTPWYNPPYHSYPAPRLGPGPMPGPVPPGPGPIPPP